MKNERQEISQYLNYYVDFGDFEGTIPEIIARLTAKQELAIEDGYSRIEITIDGGYEGKEIYVKGIRLETDEEFEYRIKDNKIRRERDKARKKKAAEEKEINERLMYENLKAKFDA